MPEYIYELRRGGEVVAAGRLTNERALTVGDEISIAGSTGIVRDAVPTADRAVRLLVQVRRQNRQ